MNIDETPAGREMDALVAEKVMPQLAPNGCRARFARNWQTNDPEWHDAGGIHWPVPAYSTDIAAAWEVFVKACHDMNIGYEGEKVGWRVREQDYEYGASIIGEAATAPLAICRAALSKAVSA